MKDYLALQISGNEVPNYTFTLGIAENLENQI